MIYFAYLDRQLLVKVTFFLVKLSKRVWLFNPLILYFKTNYDLQHIDILHFQWLAVNWYWKLAKSVNVSLKKWIINEENTLFRSSVSLYKGFPGYLRDLLSLVLILFHQNDYLSQFLFICNLAYLISFW